jgi:hypothetical protein
MAKGIGKLSALKVTKETKPVENRLKLTQSFHLKLTHPVTA